MEHRQPPSDSLNHLTLARALVAGVYVTAALAGVSTLAELAEQRRLEQVAAQAAPQNSQGEADPYTAQRPHAEAIVHTAVAMDTCVNPLMSQEVMAVYDRIYADPELADLETADPLAFGAVADKVLKELADARQAVGIPVIPPEVDRLYADSALDKPQIPLEAYMTQLKTVLDSWGIELVTTWPSQGTASDALLNDYATPLVPDSRQSRQVVVTIMRDLLRMPVALNQSGAVRRLVLGDIKQAQVAGLAGVQEGAIAIDSQLAGFGTLPHEFGHMLTAHLCGRNRSDAPTTASLTPEAFNYPALDVSSPGFSHSLATRTIAQGVRSLFGDEFGEQGVINNTARDSVVDDSRRQLSAVAVRLYGANTPAENIAVMHESLQSPIDAALLFTLPGRSSVVDIGVAQQIVRLNELDPLLGAYYTAVARAGRIERAKDMQQYGVAGGIYKTGVDRFMQSLAWVISDVANGLATGQDIPDRAKQRTIIYAFDSAGLAVKRSSDDTGGKGAVITMP